MLQAIHRPIRVAVVRPSGANVRSRESDALAPLWPAGSSHVVRVSALAPSLAHWLAEADAVVLDGVQNVEVVALLALRRVPTTYVTNPNSFAAQVTPRPPKQSNDAAIAANIDAASTTLVGFQLLAMSQTVVVDAAPDAARFAAYHSNVRTAGSLVENDLGQREELIPWIGASAPEVEHGEALTRGASLWASTFSKPSGDLEVPTTEAERCLWDGQTAEIRGQGEAAVVAYERALCAAQEWHVPAARIARLLAQAEEWNGARLWARRALDLDPRSYVAQVAHVVAARHLVSPEMAERRALEYLVDAPLNSRLYHELAAIRAARGDTHGVEEAYRLALFAHPHDFLAQRELGIRMYARRRFREAAAHLEAYARVCPQEAESRYLLACCQLRVGNMDACMESLRETLRLAPDHGRSRDLLGTLTG